MCVCARKLISRSSWEEVVGLGIRCAFCLHQTSGNASNPGPEGPSPLPRAGTPACRIYSGIGGVTLRSVASNGIGSPPPIPTTAAAPPSSLDMLLVLLLVEGGNDAVNGLPVVGQATVGRLSLRMRVKLRILPRSEITWPACGAAILFFFVSIFFSLLLLGRRQRETRTYTTVPGEALGGVGESDRNSG